MSMDENRRPPGEVIQDVIKSQSTDNEMKRITLVTAEGELDCREKLVSETNVAVLWVGGVDNSQGTPIEKLYAEAAQKLSGKGISSLQVFLRHCDLMGSMLLDVETGLAYLRSRGIETVALIGHSLGGAVVIRAACQFSTVRTAITLAAQSLGAEEIASLDANCSILLIHGTADEVIPCGCSQYLHQLAICSKKLLLFPKADHNLEPHTEFVQLRIQEWLETELREKDNP